MTTVSRFSLASKLLCFSRFDEGEYILLKLVSHGIERVGYLVERIAPVDRASRIFCQFTLSRQFASRGERDSGSRRNSVVVLGYLREHGAFCCERRISLAYGFASRQGETRNEYSEVISL